MDRNKKEEYNFLQLKDGCFVKHIVIHNCITWSDKDNWINLYLNPQENVRKFED